MDPGDDSGETTENEGLPVNCLNSSLTIVGVHFLEKKTEQVHASVNCHDIDQVKNVPYTEEQCDQHNHYAARKCVLPPSELVNASAKVFDVLAVKDEHNEVKQGAKE